MLPGQAGLRVGRCSEGFSRGMVGQGTRCRLTTLWGGVSMRKLDPGAPNSNSLCLYLSLTPCCWCASRAVVGESDRRDVPYYGKKPERGKLKAITAGPLHGQDWSLSGAVPPSDKEVLH